MKNIHESGYRLITNCNKDGGQEIDYLHFHLVGGLPLGRMIGLQKESDFPKETPFETYFQLNGVTKFIDKSKMEDCVNQLNGYNFVEIKEEEITIHDKTHLHLKIHMGLL